MHTFDYLLLTTCDGRNERLLDLIRLLHSIDAEIQTHGLRIRHYILLQNTRKLPQQLAANVSEQRILMLESGRLSLSRARNRMLQQAKHDGALATATLCAFPDDDAWYPTNLLTLILDTYKRHPHISILTCDYGSDPVSPSLTNQVAFQDAMDCGLFVRRVSSNTLFLSASLTAEVGFFDERLGVGGEINGGEDLDYALRAYVRANHQVMICEDKLVGHRDRLPWVRSHYFAGSLFAIARSARNDLQLAAQLLRKIAVGGFLVISRELSIGAYLSGLRSGLSGLTILDPLVAPFE